MFSLKFILIKNIFERNFDSINCVESTLQSLLILILSIIYEVCIFTMQNHLTTTVTIECNWS